MIFQERFITVQPTFTAVFLLLQSDCNQLFIKISCVCSCVSRGTAILAVQWVSGRIWEFPITLIATEPQVDDVILTEATEFGKTSAVAFRLTSTTRCVCLLCLISVPSEFANYLIQTSVHYTSNIKCGHKALFDKRKIFQELLNNWT